MAADIAKLGIQVDSSGVKSANRALDQLDRRGKKVESRFKSFGRSARRVGGYLTGFVSTPLAGIGVLAVKTAADFETLQLKLDTLTGSAEQGAQAFKDLTQYAASTPFELKDVVKADTTLLGFGNSARKSFQYLKELSDISAVTGANLQGLTVAFGQSSASTQVMTRDLRQFINNGVPVLKLLSNYLGVAQNKILDLASQSKISFSDIQGAFKKATSAGGLFNEGAKKLSKTLNGLYSTIKGNLSLALGNLGETIVKTIRLKELSEKIVSLTKQFSELSDSTKTFIVIAGGIAAALGPAIVALGVLSGSLSVIATTTIPAVIGAFETLYLAALINPVTAAVIALGSAITALGVASVTSGKKINNLIGQAKDLSRINIKNSSWQDLEDQIGRINKKIAQLRGQPKTVLNYGAPATNLYSKDIDALLKKRQAAQKKLDKIKPKGILQTGSQLLDSFGLGVNSLLKKKHYIFRPKVDIKPDIETSPTGLSDAQKEIQKVLSGLDGQLGQLSLKAKFGNIFPDTAAQRIDIIKEALSSLIEKGLTPADAAFQKVLSTYNAYKTTIGKAGLAGLTLNKINTQPLYDLIAKTDDFRTSAEIALGKTADKTSKLKDLFGDTSSAVDNLGFTFSSAFEDAIVNGNRLSDVLQGLLKDIERIILRAAITKPLGNALSGAIGNILPFGGGKASGGPVYSGKSYVVGEQGPELFSPSKNGHITPNGGGGVTVNVINNNGSQVKTTKRKKSDGGLEIGVLIDNRVKSSFDNGRYDQHLNSNFNINRSGY